jgi:hypothetical protein
MLPKLSRLLSLVICVHTRAGYRPCTGGVQDEIARAQSDDLCSPWWSKLPGRIAHNEICRCVFCAYYAWLFMLCAGASLGIDVHVYGPETHMTAVVGAALGKRALPARAIPSTTTTQFLLPNATDSVGSKGDECLYFVRPG